MRENKSLIELIKTENKADCFNRKNVNSYEEKKVDSKSSTWNNHLDIRKSFQESYSTVHSQSRNEIIPNGIQVVNSSQNVGSSRAIASLSKNLPPSNSLPEWNLRLKNASYIQNPAPKYNNPILPVLPNAFANKYKPNKN